MERFTMLTTMVVLSAVLGFAQQTNLPQQAQPAVQMQQAQVQPAATDKPTCIPVGSSKSPIKKTHVPKKLAAFWDKQRAKISDKTGVDLGSAQDIKDSLTPPPCPVVPAAPAAQATPVTSK